MMCALEVTSVMSVFSRPYGLQLASILCSWDPPGNNTRVNCQALLKGIFLTQRSKLHLLWLRPCQAGSLPLAQSGKHTEAFKSFCDTHKQVMSPSFMEWGHWCSGSFGHTLARGRPDFHLIRLFLFMAGPCRLSSLVLQGYQVCTP